MGFGFFEDRRRAKVLRDYRGAVRGWKAVLLDTPTHGNIGDQAIALAEQLVFEEVYGAGRYGEVLAADLDGIEERFADVTPQACIVYVHGGGFLGDLWPNEEERLRRILQAFRRHRVVILPQTASFALGSPAGRECLRQSQLSYEGHPNLTLCARERNTYELLQSRFALDDVRLLPDAVLSLDVSVVEVPVRNRCGTIFCMRSDKERILTEEDRVFLKKQIAQVPQLLPCDSTDMITDEVVSVKKRRGLVEGKLAAFARAKLIVTDRLHGMVFAALAGTPCIALGNCSGKVKAVHQWIEGLDYIKYIDTPSEFANALAEIDFEKPYRYDSAAFFMQLTSALASFDNDYKERIDCVREA